MSDFVLVKHDNGLVSPVSRALAEARGLETVEGDTHDLAGRLVKPVRANGRPVKKRTSVKKAAAKKAVTPDEGAADNTLTNTKE